MKLNSCRLLACWLLISTCLPALADHPTDLDHLLRQVKQAHERESSVRHEREKRFLSEKTDDGQLNAGWHVAVRAVTYVKSFAARLEPMAPAAARPSGRKDACASLAVREA